ncbi:MAG: hypothetical protein MSIBF_06980 [Candidatus Altiarchaeales archaeon IMC4]|nr:MAG: hypothetical protein MSIBF_06980 [Candidatus Altiarchaeales archaeon IMC4]
MFTNKVIKMESVNVNLKNIENQMENMAVEMTVIKRVLGVKTETKTNEAWQGLEKLGRKIGKSWKSSKPSWEIVSESRG